MARKKKWRKTEKLEKEKEKKLRGKDKIRVLIMAEGEVREKRRSSWKFLSQIICPEQMDSDYPDSIRVNQTNKKKVGHAWGNKLTAATKLLRVNELVVTTTSERYWILLPIIISKHI
jgi:hypothetical protein